MNKKIVSVFIFSILCALAGCTTLRSNDINTNPSISESAVRQEVIFKTYALQSMQAPQFNEDHIAIRTIDFDEMLFTLYQLSDEDSHYYLYVTIGETNYDLGVVGNHNTNVDVICDSAVQKTLISSMHTIYKLQREEEFDIVTTTYFAIDNNTPVLLYSIPGFGKQCDIDNDGQIETIANSGLSTSPNYLLYEWDIDANEIHIADLRKQLSCDVLVFDDAELCFIAAEKMGNEWHRTTYEYQEPYLDEKQDSVE